MTMKLTTAQRELVTENVILEIKSRLNLEEMQATSICGAIINDVVADIEDCADWTGYNDDEVNLADIDIACTRVLTTR